MAKYENNDHPNNHPNEAWPMVSKPPHGNRVRSANQSKLRVTRTKVKDLGRSDAEKEAR